LKSFYTDVIAKDKRFLSKKAVNDLALLEPGTRAAVQAVIKDAWTLYGVRMMAYETFRSKPRQADLFANGATKLQKVGVHHYGLACDIVRNIGGKPSWKGDFSFLVALCLKHKLISGIDWGEPKVTHTFVDSCHVQRIPVSRQADLFAGRWYPPVDYDPRGANK